MCLGFTDKAWLLSREGKAISAYKHPTQKYQFDEIIELINEYGSNKAKSIVEAYHTSPTEPLKEEIIRYYYHNWCKVRSWGIYNDEVTFRISIDDFNWYSVIVCFLTEHPMFRRSRITVESDTLLQQKSVYWDNIPYSEAIGIENATILKSKLAPEELPPTNIDDGGTMDYEFDYIDIKIVSGERILKPREHVIGYCHFPGHKGGITRKIIREHECLAKECTYLEKYADNPYWTEIKKHQAGKAQRKEYIKQKKAESAAVQKHKNAITDIYYEIALCIIDQLGYDLKVLSIKKVPDMKKFILFYISRNSYNDWYQYYDLAREFGKKTGHFVELKHAKNVDGSYATF